MITAAALLFAAASFNPVEFFRGRSHGQGVLKIIFQSSKTISVDSFGTSEKDGSLVLKQIIHEPGTDPRTRYWNTGSWIYEPELGSREAYDRYLQYAWPGTAILIDEDAPQPQLLELLADLNPRNGGEGLPSPS